MAITYAQTSDLMNDQVFKGRTQVACLHFASYINNEDPATPAHASRLRWAQATIQTPMNSVTQIMPVLVMDDKVQTAGDAILDPDLQIAVETSVNKFI